MSWLHSYYFVVVLMAVSVYICRIGGYWLAGKVKLGDRIRSWLSYLPGCIIISIIAPLFKTATLLEWFGAIATVAIMIVTDNLLISMCFWHRLGCFVALYIRCFVGFYFYNYFSFFFSVCVLVF